MEGLSTTWMFHEHHRSRDREREAQRRYDEVVAHNNELLCLVQKQEQEIDRLQSENSALHQRQFKERASSKKEKTSSAQTPQNQESPLPKKRGAPLGHPPWNRAIPEIIDHRVVEEAPCCCPHCQTLTDLSQSESSSFIQEDIVLQPKTVVTEYVQQSAWCPTCGKQVFQSKEGLPDYGPIGPQAKAAALYLRHELKIPYRKIQKAMLDLFGLEFVPASVLGFEKRARVHAQPLYNDLLQKLHASPLAHADETHWREDGQGAYIWYAGNQDLAVFLIQMNRSMEAAKNLLGDIFNGFLVTDAYASYNGIASLGRQSCLAHLLRKAKDVLVLLGKMKNPDPASVRFCNQFAKLMGIACDLKIPKKLEHRKVRIRRLTQTLDWICNQGNPPLGHPKAETLRKRFLPGAREYTELFAFIEFDAPPTNNHAERALRPLVIFRKVCMGTRSPIGSLNIGIFASLVETTHLQRGSVIGLFQQLMSGSILDAQLEIFPNGCAENMS
jgi:transposase